MKVILNCDPVALTHHLQYSWKSTLFSFHLKVANISTPSAKDRPPKNDGSPAQPSQTTRSTSWKSAFCTRNTCHRPTETRSHSSWVWPTHRSSPGSRTDGPSSRGIWRRWRRTWSLSRKFRRRHCRNWCPWRTWKTLTVARGPFLPVSPREPSHSPLPHPEAKPQTSSQRRMRKSRWTIKSRPLFSEKGIFHNFCTDSAEELDMQAKVSVSLIFNLLKGPLRSDVQIEDMAEGIRFHKIWEMLRDKWYSIKTATCVCTF